MAATGSDAVIVSRSELTAHLSPSLGEAKAAELIQTTASKLGLNAVQNFSKPQALSVLQEISGTPGLVGVVARCAKTRIILQKTKP